MTTRRPAVSGPLLACFLAAALAPRLAAQDTYDRGVFVVTRDGEEVGREEFAITASTTHGAPGFLAVTTYRADGREVQRALEVSSDYVPTSYQETETAGGRVVSRVSAELSGARFSARVASQSGETAREFPVRPPVAIVPPDAVCLFYFLPRPDSGTRALTVVTPRDPRARDATVAALGPDSVTIAGRKVDTRRFALRIGADERDFWFTPAGDLVQVSEPARGLLSIRTDLPSH